MVRKMPAPGDLDHLISSVSLPVQAAIASNRLIT